MTITKLQKLIRAARGEIPADLVLKGGKVINVFSCEIQKVDVAISEDSIVGLGVYQGLETIDCRDRFICPGFIDGHLHIESTLLTPANLAPVLLPHGTTTLIADPHEIANVLGLAGIEFMLENSAGLSLEMYFMAPSCVPATHLETSGAILTAEDLSSLGQHPRILGLGEMMNFPGVLSGDREVLKKLTSFPKEIKDGHAPLLSGKDLNAYLTAGIRSDHETLRLSEAREKLSLGMVLMIREGSKAKNLKALLPLVTSSNARRCLLVTDDRHPEDLLQEGHLDFVIRQAIGMGLNPFLAIQMATLNAAEYFGLRHLGAVAPGYQADLVILNSIPSMEIEAVYKKGKLVAREGRFLGDPPRIDRSIDVTGMHIKGLNLEKFKIPRQGEWAHVIELIPDQILTRKIRHKVQEKNGLVALRPEEDIVILACVERHKGTGNVGLGLVKGFGLAQGALASSVAHDSHNIVVIGRDPEDMLLAVQTIEEMKGGLAVVVRGKVEAKLSLPIAGLMSDQAIEQVIFQEKTLLQAVPLTGCLQPNPFMTLSFLALPVIPELKITDKGLVDVNRFEIVPLFD
ncbi:MAG: adenine deaminase [Desulfobacca sp.]|nr:adenine deaminase [Desulfobacca sp.]